MRRSLVALILVAGLVAGCSESLSDAEWTYCWTGTSSGHLKDAASELGIDSDAVRAKHSSTGSSYEGIDQNALREDPDWVRLCKAAVASR